MCFCHSIFIFKIIPILKIILIFEIILVFKIMIVIRFQIWFLIKFKLQRREWVWLKLDFSHAKGLWHYKYRSQGMKKRGRLERKTLKEETLEEAITRNRKREKHKQRRGRRTLYKPPPPSTLFFLAQSPSTSPPAAARLGKFPSFLAKIINWLLLHACVNLSRMARLDPAQKEKKRVGRVWALGLTDPNCVC